MNPVDNKNRALGVAVKSWPAVIGNDAAGVIDLVGDFSQGLQIG